MVTAQAGRPVKAVTSQDTCLFLIGRYFRERGYRTDQRIFYGTQHYWLGVP